MPRNWLDFLNIPPQWPYTRGKGVRVAVLDEAAGSVYARPVNYEPGRVHFHGQGVAYIVHSIAPEAEIFGINVLTSPVTGAPSWGLDKALRWCIDNGIDLANMSVQGFNEPENVQAVKEAAEAGIILVACAGNTEGKGVTYPGRDPNVIPVAAYWPMADRIAVTDAIGPEIFITAPTAAEVPAPAGGWTELNATSGATPHITGSLALYMTRFKEVNRRRPTLAECRGFLIRNAKDLLQPGRDERSGYGLFKFPEPERWPERKEEAQIETDYKGSVWIGSPNFKAGRQGRAIIAIVMHVMDGTLAGTDAWFQNAVSAQASAHYGVGKGGQVHQYVKEADMAWHAGTVNEPTWTGYDGTNPNAYTVGVECEGHPGDEWPEEQYQALLALTKDICARQGIPMDRDHLIGHYQLDSVNRANDPGPTFPWDRLLGDLRGEPPQPEPVTEQLGAETETGGDQAVATVIELWIGRNVARLNGEEVTLDQAPEVDPQTNRSLMPVRFVAEALGGSVEWDGAEEKITITREEK